MPYLLVDCIFLICMKLSAIKFWSLQIMHFLNFSAIIILFLVRFFKEPAIVYFSAGFQQNSLLNADMEIQTGDLH